MISKSYKNNENAGVSTLLAIILFSITVSSILTSFFLLNFYGVSVYGVNTPDSPMQLPTGTSLKIFSQTQDFKNNSYDLETLSRQRNGKWSFVDGVGYFLTGLGSDSGFSYLLIDNLQSDNKVYENSYWINNTVKGDYCIILRYTGGSDANEICVEDNDFYIPSNLWDKITGQEFRYDYPNANQIEDVNIKTIYNDGSDTTDPSVDFYFNGDLLFRTSKLNKDANILDWFGRYYGGLGSRDIGFTFEEFQTQNPVVNTAAQENGLMMIAGYLFLIIKIMVWNIDPLYLPWEINIIFVKTQVAVMGICIAMIIRGTGG